MRDRQCKTVRQPRKRGSGEVWMRFIMALAVALSLAGCSATEGEPDGVAKVVPPTDLSSTCVKGEKRCSA